MSQFDALNALKTSRPLEPSTGSVAQGDARNRCDTLRRRFMPDYGRSHQGAGHGLPRTRRAALPQGQGAGLGDGGTACCRVRPTPLRSRREAAAGKQSGRTQEIQRLIGRSLRAVVDLKALGERQITLDCDVIQADGGTRCASITAAWVALSLACDKLLDQKPITANPLLDQVAAVSCGIYENTPVLDLDYDEDLTAETDSNFVLTGSGHIVEIQATGEKRGYRAMNSTPYVWPMPVRRSCSPCNVLR